MKKIEIPLTVGQASVVITASLMLQQPYLLKLEMYEGPVWVDINNDNMGFDIIDKIENLLMLHGFNEKYESTSFGNVCAKRLFASVIFFPRLRVYAAIYCWKRKICILFEEDTDCTAGLVIGFDMVCHYASAGLQVVAGPIERAGGEAVDHGSARQRAARAKYMYHPVTTYGLNEVGASEITGKPKDGWYEVKRFLRARRLRNVFAF